MIENPEGYIIGEGYVGGFFKQSQPDWLGTHREQQTANTVIFDRMVRSSWNNVGKANYCLLTCPLKEGSDFLFKEFLAFLKDRFTYITLLSSVSVFLEKGSQITAIDESSVLDPTKTQVKREESILALGGNVLNLVGIYGPNRSPVGWLKQDLVSPAKIFVNLIHVFDIVHIIDKIFKKKISGERYIVNDGQKYYWETIIDFCQQKNLLPQDFVRSQKKEPVHRYVSNKKLLKLISLEYEFQNFYNFLESEEH